MSAVYSLTWPEQRIAYVGCSRRGKRRIRAHRVGLRSGRHPHERLLDAYVAHGRPEGRVELTCRARDMYRLEAETARRYASEGWTVLSCPRSIARKETRR